MQKLMLLNSVSNHALELYLLACQFDLQALEEACKPTAIRMHDIVRPNEHVDTIGLTRAADLVSLGPTSTAPRLTRPTAQGENGTAHQGSRSSNQLSQPSKKAKEMPLARHHGRGYPLGARLHGHVHAQSSD